MYGKLFASMYDGTLYGQWQAIVTLQQMVILADEDGVVDITPPALAAKTSIPLEIIEKGLGQLAEPDRYSRSEKNEGRRIIPIDEDRPWGWVIVNYRHYRELASREDKKRKDRERIAEKRRLNNDVADSREVSQSVADVAHTDTDTNKKKKPLSGKPDPCQQVFEHWQKAMDHPRAKLDAKRTRNIKARLKDGYTVTDLLTAIDGCRKTPHNMGENEQRTKYDDIELICRDAVHVDRFIANAEGRGIKSESGNQPPHMRPL